MKGGTPTTHFALSYCIVRVAGHAQHWQPPAPHHSHAHNTGPWPPAQWGADASNQGPAPGRLAGSIRPRDDGIASLAPGARAEHARRLCGANPADREQVLLWRMEAISRTSEEPPPDTKSEPKFRHFFPSAPERVNGKVSGGGAGPEQALASFVPGEAGLFKATSPHASVTRTVIRLAMPFNRAPPASIVDVLNFPFFGLAPHGPPSQQHLNWADFTNSFKSNVPPTAQHALFEAACDMATRAGRGNAAVINCVGLLGPARAQREAWEWHTRRGKWGLFPSEDGVLTPTTDEAHIKGGVETTPTAARRAHDLDCMAMITEITLRRPEFAGIESGVFYPESTISYVVHFIAGHRVITCAERLAATLGTGIEFEHVYGILKAAIAWGTYVIAVQDGPEFLRFVNAGPVGAHYWRWGRVTSHLGESVRAPSLSLSPEFSAPAAPPPQQTAPAPTASGPQAPPTARPQPPAAMANRVREHRGNRNPRPPRPAGWLGGAPFHLPPPYAPMGFYGGPRPPPPPGHFGVPFPMPFPPMEAQHARPHAAAGAEPPRPLLAIMDRPLAGAGGVLGAAPRPAGRN